MSPVAPIAAHAMLVLLLELAALLGVAMALGRLAGRCGLPAVVGELLAGIVLGPSVLGHLAPDLGGWLLPRDAVQLNLLDAVGQLGVLLLVALAGMHVDLRLVRRQGPAATVVSAAGLLVPLLAGVAVAFTLPATMWGAHTERTVFALFLGVALCVSAIPVIAKILLEMRLLHRDIGQLILTAAVLDDLAGWSLLAVVSAMATTGAGAGQAALAAGQLVVALAVAALVGRPVVRAVLGWATRTGEQAVSVPAVVVLVLAAAAGAQALHLEPVLGAFLAGILIGADRSTPAVDLTALRTFVLTVLAPLFFATAGLRMDLTALWTPSTLVAGTAVLAVAVVGKFAGAYLGARLARLGHWTGLAVGAGLNARGVIEVIIAMVGLRLGILTTASFTVIVLVAVVTSLMTPPLLRAAVRRMPATPAEQARVLTLSESEVRR